MVIEIKKLSHTYMPDTVFSKTAVSNINLKIEQGEFIGLIGHSGSGKSTLIQHLNGLMKATEGEILADGENIFKNKEALRDIRIEYKVGIAETFREIQTARKLLSEAIKNKKPYVSDPDKREPVTE